MKDLSQDSQSPSSESKPGFRKHEATFGFILSKGSEI